MANNRPQAKQAAQLQAMTDNDSAQNSQPIQKKENNTGLPDNLKTGMVKLSERAPAFPQLLQLRALSVGAIGAGSRTQTEGGAVRQLAVMEVGQAGGSPQDPHSLRSQADVQGAVVRNDELLWPSISGVFNGDYSGSVQRAMAWGLKGGEGTAGWYSREYPAAAFNAIAAAAGIASNALVGINPALDNDPNKTLVAIRAFRGPNDGSMAGRTSADLGQVHAAVTGQAVALHAAGLITDAAAAVTSITADPAEAHPNTLPTARVVFGGAGTVYFKGRGHAVENALVGSGVSSARALSSLAGANPVAAEGVGMHGFVGVGLNQIAGDVGAEVPPALDPVTRKEMALSYLPALFGGADVPPRPQAVAAWLSAAKGALLASLSATTDLHPSNIKAGGSGKSHIIDAEFLLDVTQWQAYQTMIAGGAIANFEVGKFVPPWLQTHMATLSPGTKNLMANAVVARFNALQANQVGVQNAILAPINALIATPALLRVIPLGTDDFLRYVTYYHNALPANRDGVVDALWTAIGNAMNGKITVNNDGDGKPELTVNLGNGMVPLFHLRTNDGAFRLNKQINIGNTVAGRSVADLLTQTRAAVTHRYADMAAMVHDAITA